MFHVFTNHAADNSDDYDARKHDSQSNTDFGSCRERLGATFKDERADV